MVPRTYDETRKSPNQDGKTTAGPTVAQVLPRFLEYERIEAGLALRTIESYRQRLGDLVKLLGDRHVTDISAEDLMLFKRKLMDRGNQPASIRATLSCLRTLLRYLRDVEGFEVYDPEKVRIPRLPTREVKYLTGEELERLMAAIPTDTFAGTRDRALVEVLFSTGMRISEAMSLQRDQIDWEKREARIIGKGSRERRIYFSPAAVEALDRYFRLRHDDIPFVFVTRGDGAVQMNPKSAAKQFRVYGRRAGLAKRVHPHMLRHTMATTLLKNGCPMGHIRVLLGHAHLATTCRYYLGRLSDAEAKAAHEKYLVATPDDMEAGRDNVEPGALTAEAA